MPLTSAVWPGIFTALVQPAASAGASERTTSTTGEFQGTMMPATPAGWRSVCPYTPGETSAVRPESVSASAAA
jgi:hypothetical protein